MPILLSALVVKPVLGAMAVGNVLVLAVCACLLLDPAAGSRPATAVAAAFQQSPAN